jgi:hypothetical protein
VRRRLPALEAAGRATRVALGWVAVAEPADALHLAYVRASAHRLLEAAHDIAATLDDAGARPRGPATGFPTRSTLCES